MDYSSKKELTEKMLKNLADLKTHIGGLTEIDKIRFEAMRGLVASNRAAVMMAISDDVFTATREAHRLVKTINTRYDITADDYRQVVNGVIDKLMDAVKHSKGLKAPSVFTGPQNQTEQSEGPAR